MESCINHQNLRHPFQHRRDTLNSLNVSAGMKRRQGSAFFKVLQNLLGNQHRFGEIGTSVDDPMADRLNFIHGTDHAVVLVCQCFYDQLHCKGMVRNADLGFIFFLAHLVNDLAALFQSDTIAQPLCKHSIILFGIKKLILQGRASCVYNQYNHFCLHCFLSSTYPFIIVYPVLFFKGFL